MAVFLVDQILIRLDSVNRFIKAIRRMDVDHPMRRFLIPFTFGTVYANRVYNEYLKKKGLFHRIFAFKYTSLTKLVEDTFDGGLNVNNLSWPAMIKFIDQYMDLFWLNDDEIANDEGLAEFIRELFSKDPEGDKNEVILAFASMIYLVSVNKDNAMKCATFEYNIGPEYTGLKIRNKGLMAGNTTQSYAEYCLFVLCAGYKYMNFDGSNCKLEGEDLDLLITGYMRRLKRKCEYGILSRICVDIVCDYFDEDTDCKCLWEKCLLDYQYDEAKKLFDYYYPLINEFYSPDPPSPSIML